MFSFSAIAFLLSFFGTLSQFYVLKEKIGSITNDEINNALRKAYVVYDNANVESAIYIKLDEQAKRFDEMLETFSLEKLTLHETATSIQKKLKLPSVYRG